jgi:hypothetical protein
MANDQVQVYCNREREARVGTYYVLVSCKNTVVVVANQRWIDDDAMSQWAIDHTATAATLLCQAIPAEPHMYAQCSSVHLVEHSVRHSVTHPIRQYSHHD